MVMAGIGIGSMFTPLNYQARLSQPFSRFATVIALQLFAYNLGGTIGLTQSATIMNSKVREYFDGLPVEFLGFIGGSALNGVGVSSLDAINNLPPDVQASVRNAFRVGVRWCFIALVPWVGIAFFLNLGLSRVGGEPKPESDDSQHENVQLNYFEAQEKRSGNTNKLVFDIL